MAVKRNIPKDFFDGNIMRSYDEIFLMICNNINISKNQNGRFIYFIDIDYVMDTTRGYRYENLTPAYDMILKRGLMQLKYSEETNEFCKSFNNVCDGLCILSDRISEWILKTFGNDKRSEWFKRMKTKQAEHFEEAIQRMLFINQIFWQMDHRLVGLGAWDTFLYPYYEKDILDGTISKESALVIIEDLFRVLHEYYDYKSNVLMGDTGQIFVLGRSNPQGDYLYNELTYLFIEAMKNVQQPDPKCLLRINKNTPEEILRLALSSISTGLGAPLLANDDVIVPCLTDFGIIPEDACEYTTSACWEPLIGGKSSCNNNRTPLNYLKALDNLFKREDLARITDFDDFVDMYLIYLRRNLRAVKRVLKYQIFQNNPLLSVFTYGCYERKKDVSQGGAMYGDIGITSVAMGNTINSLFNIKKFVFDEKRFTLYDVKQMIAMDFKGYEDIFTLIKDENSYFGRDDDTAISMVQRIMDFVSNELKDYEGFSGERIKVGLSGAAYMDAARRFSASFDGRHYGDPFIVHISNETNDSFTEIVNFASELNYRNNQFNGNVIDFITSPNFISHNMDKFVLFLHGAVKSGFFEMQMNVIDSKTLIEAKQNPEKFPNLIVRVWGFSAYFIQLPESYQDVLIERALENEHRSLASL